MEGLAKFVNTSFDSRRISSDAAETSTSSLPPGYPIIDTAITDKYNDVTTPSRPETPIDVEETAEDLSQPDDVRPVNLSLGRDDNDYVRDHALSTSRPSPPPVMRTHPTPSFLMERHLAALRQDSTATLNNNLKITADRFSAGLTEDREDDSVSGKRC